MGPVTPAAEALHAMKYRQEGETFRDCVNRVAQALKDDDRHYHELREVLGAQRFVPAGRVQAAMGSLKQVTAFNCFASGRIEDSFVHGEGSIMDRAKEAAATMRMGGGIGYDFSTLRPRGALIRKLRSASSGPLAFMGIFNEVCRCTSSSGHRRGAQMGVLRVDHPDILEFINAKHDQQTLTGFNMSVAVTDRFMEAVDRGTGFDLTFQGEVHATVDAQALWENLMRSTWDWAEPGVLFIDTMNRMNNLGYCEEITATNPCAEQPFPPFAACLLGSFNLVKYLVARATPGAYDFDWDRLHADIPPVVRAMDNVTDRSLFPLPQQWAEAMSKRRMGIGVMGLANALEAMGMPYGSPAFLAFQSTLAATIANECYRAGALLAAEKGSFPLYDKEWWNDAPFVRTLDPEVRALLRRNGSRCSHYTSWAPTGTIASTCDNVSSSGEPVFSYGYSRPVNTPQGQVVMEVEDYGVRFLGHRGRRAHEVTVAEHVDVLLCAARHVDSSVSKTVNCDGSTPWEDFKNVYRRVWEGGGKGCSTFNSDGRRFALLSSADGAEERPASVASGADDVQACTFDTVTGQRECA